MKRIIIIGGGGAGLGAAYKVARAASEGHDVEFVLFEKDPCIGGKICTEILMDPSGGGRFVVDGGPDCFLTEKPACHRIAKLLGIFDDELPTDESRKRTWILSRGKLHQLPEYRIFPQGLPPILSSIFYLNPTIKIGLQPPYIIFLTGHYCTKPFS